MGSAEAPKSFREAGDKPGPVRVGPESAAAPPDGGGPERRRTLVLVCLGAFMATLDTSIVNIALPQMAHDFESSLAGISWVMVIYLLVNVSLLLTCGRLGDLLAPGRLYLLGMATFTGASALCGLSPSLAWMAAARALQAVGGSLMLGLAPKIIALIYGEGERGLALGLFSTAFAAGISVGGPLGGAITSYLGWPYIFFINLPIGALGLGLGREVMTALRPPGAWSWDAFDFKGAVVLAGSLGLLFLGLTRIRDAGAMDWPAVAALVGAAAGFSLLMQLERRAEAPLLHGKLWRSWPFLVGSVAVVVTFAAVMGAFFLLPFCLEQIYHYSPGQTGLLLAALSVTNALVAPLGGYLADRWGNLVVLRTGTGLVLLGLGSLIVTGPQDSTPSLTARLIVTGLGFGLFQAPNLNEILRGVSPSLVGLAASTNAVLKNLGALLGITLTVTTFAWFRLHQVGLGPEVRLNLTAFHYAFGVAALVGALSFAVNLLPRGIGGRPNFHPER
jgi:EmrB/QacA subfamily drug resistance transporter